MAPKARAGLTQVQKYELCILRSKNSNLKLSEFAELPECPQRPDGRTLALSSLSEHIKGWKQKVLEGQPLGSEAGKQKVRKAQFPIFEFLLAKWVDAAEYAKVPVTDDVLRAQSLVIQEHLTRIGCEEIYAEFTMSNGWLQKFKERHLIGRLKRHGEAGSVDLRALPSQRAEIRHQLRSYTLCDIWNCDESGLQYNKQPAYSNVRKEPGKVLAGVKLDKTRITTFHVTNADGSEKRKLLIIGRAQTPQAFRQNRININNLPVTYRFNKKAWMLSGLWYEFLRTLNEEMRIKGRNIALLSDNCPSHPHPSSPPENYDGPLPPVLTNISLIYLPPNSTSRLQPLDQGIIASFKSAYRRQYANFMVSYFNTHNRAPPKLNILSAIHLMAEAWDAIPASTIQNCWRRSGLIGEINDPVAISIQPHTIEPFIQQAESETRASLKGLNPDLNPDVFNKDFHNFFYFDDMGEPETSSVLSVPDAITLTDKFVELGILDLGPEKMNLSDLDSPGDDTEEIDFNLPPSITTVEAVNYIRSITRHLLSLPISTLTTPAGRNLSIPTVIQTTTYLASALSLYGETLKKKSKIDNFFKPLSSRSTTRTRLQLTSDGQPTATVGLHENSEEVWEGGPLEMVEVGVAGMEKRKEKEAGCVKGKRPEDKKEGSETGDEEEGNSSRKQNELQVHPYDSQDLNLYPANFQDFSQAYANLLH